MTWTAEQVSALANVVTAFAALAALGAAWRGLSTWREELRARAQHEAALKVLSGLFKVEAAIRALREPMILAVEGQGRAFHMPEFDHQREAANTIFALGNRWNRIADVMPEWEVALAEARALWGNLLQTPADVIRGKVGALQVNLGLYFQELRGEVNLGDQSPTLRRIISGGEGPTPDTFGREIAAAVQDFEARVQPFVDARPPRGCRRGWRVR